MNLTLEVISANGSRLGAGRRKVFGAEGGRIGRGSDCDWILPSPARYVSRHHANIQFKYGQFYVTPEGENSVAVNNPNAVLAFAESRQLKQGDRIYIDEYEILASVPNEYDAAPLVGDPFADVPGIDASGPLIDSPDLQSVDPLAGLPGGDEKPIAPMFIDLPQGSLLDEPFVPPPRIAPESPPIPPRYVPSPSSAQSGSQPKLVIPSDPNAWNQPDVPSPPPVRDLAPKAGRLPIPPAAPLTPPAPVARPAPPRAPPKPQPVPAPAAPVAAGGFDVDAMLRAAGVDPANVAPETAATLGEILMTVVQGTIDALRARDEVKSQFRLAVTRVKAAQNNPLTFALDAKDAMQSLLTRQNAAFLPPLEAFQRAFDDIRNHQMAMLAGMRAGFEHLLERFDPEQLQESFDKQAKRSALLGVGKPKYWDLYADHYAALRGDRDDAFRRLFGEEFALAYEKQVELIRHTRGTKSQ